MELKCREHKRPMNSCIDCSIKFHNADSVAYRLTLNDLYKLNGHKLDTYEFLRLTLKDEIDI